MFRLFKNRYFWLLFLVIVVLLITMNLTESDRQDITVVEKLIRDAFTPLQGGVNEFRDDWSGFSVALSDKKVLQNQIERLKSENQQLQLDNQELMEYKQEVKRLRGLLNFSDLNLATYDLVAARVIARSPNNWYKYIVVDKGASDGLAKGMSVISSGGLVGRIESVSENSAQVSLITDREMAVGVILQETRETNGIVEGVGNNNHLRMMNIPYYSEIQKGDKVITSGLSSIYPKGIQIGTVTEITREPNGLLLSATVRPEVNFDKLEEVLIITRYHPPVVIENDGEEES